MRRCGSPRRLGAGRVRRWRVRAPGPEESSSETREAGSGSEAREDEPAWGKRMAPSGSAVPHRATVLNDDLLGQHDTAVGGPFLLLPLRHFTILLASRSQRAVVGGGGGHYSRAEPLGAPAAILRARPASGGGSGGGGGASHRAIGRREATPTRIGHAHTAPSAVVIGHARVTQRRPRRGPAHSTPTCSCDWSRSRPAHVF